jgi:hypothetical protein
MRGKTNVMNAENGQVSSALEDQPRPKALSNFASGVYNVIRPW